MRTRASGWQLARAIRRLVHVWREVLVHPYDGRLRGAMGIVGIASRPAALENGSLGFVKLLSGRMRENNLEQGHKV